MLRIDHNSKKIYSLTAVLTLFNAVTAVIFSKNGLDIIEINSQGVQTIILLTRAMKKITVDLHCSYENN